VLSFIKHLKNLVEKEKKISDKDRFIIDKSMQFPVK